MFYYFITVPLPVTNLMLRQADFPGYIVNDYSTVDVIVTWNEVRMLYIYCIMMYTLSIIATIISSSSYYSICNQSQYHYWSNNTSKLFTT